MNRRQTLPFLLAAMALAGCSAPPPRALRLGINPWVGYDPLVLARERGLLDPRQVHLVELPSSTESLRTLRNGLLDAAALTLDEALRLSGEGLALKIVAVLDVSHGADAVVARPGIGQPAGLRGQRIAVEQTALGALVLERVLAAGGLGHGDVRVVQAEAASHVSLLTSGQVDAVITFEPMKSALVQRGHPVIFDSRQMPGDIVDVLVVTAQAALAQSSQIVATLVAWERGRQALLLHPETMAVLLARGTGLDAAQYQRALDGLTLASLDDNLPWLGNGPGGLAQQSGPLVEVLLRLGVIRHRPDWPGLLAGAAATCTQARLVAAA